VTAPFSMRSDCLSLSLDLDAGHLLDVMFHDQGRHLQPLHAAPWAVDDLPDSEPMVNRRLSGDFLCAPFCQSDIEPAPWHGWSANSAWRPIGTGADLPGDTSHAFELENRILGARVEKQLRLVAGQPILHQRHIFHGGEGALPVGHHAMLRTDSGLKVSFSPKRFGLTPQHAAAKNPAEGISVLAYPQTFGDLRQLRLHDGKTVDATLHPYAVKTEDHIYLFEAADSDLAWSAAVNRAEGYVFFALKDPKILPATLLWVSNYGLKTPPFYGRHGDCLGIEEICANLALGHAASIAKNPLSDQGIPTALALSSEGVAVIDYFFGCVAVGPEWQEIVAIQRDDRGITLHDTSGKHRQLTIRLPF
jgi:hypothetical protein